MTTLQTRGGPAAPGDAGRGSRSSRWRTRLAWLRPGAPTEPRLTRRRRLILGSLLPAVLLLVLAARLLLLPVHMGQAQDAHGRGDGPGMVDAGGRLGVLNLVERWRAPFVEGTGHAMAGELAEGRGDLELALSRTGNPQDDCTVRTNLVLTVSAQADEAAEGGDTEGERRYADEALRLIDEGPEGCLDGSDDGNEGEAGRAQREEQEKLQEQTGQEPEEQEGEDQDGDQQEQQQGGDEPQDPQEKELAERNQDGSDTAEKERRQDRSGSGPDPVEKPW